MKSFGLFLPENTPPECMVPAARLGQAEDPKRIWAGAFAALQQVDFTETTKVTIKCKFCGSDAVSKYGVRDGVQQYWCKSCRRKFAGNNALPGMRYLPEHVASGLNMFYEGMSLNAVTRQLQHDFGIQPADSTVYDWVVKFTQQAIEPLPNISVQLSDVWVIDETVLKVNGKNVWFWDVIDDETRFLVASHLSMSRTMGDTIAVLQAGQAIASKPPKFIVSDGLRSYPDAVDRVFGADTVHVRSNPFVKGDELSTNLIERFHGTLKQRTKVMRGMQNLETARIVMDGWLIHYNYFRPHESLGDKTPGSVAQGNYPYTSWKDVVTDGYISTEKRETTRVAH